MNRIILIGNGFDLAHGMNTSYNNFLDKYWADSIEVLKKHPLQRYENEIFTISVVPRSWSSTNTYDNLQKSLIRIGSSIIFKNHFFELLSKTHHLENWVDIENEYYKHLNEAFKHSQYSITDLNKDFEQVKILLETHLNETIQEFDRNFNDNKFKNIIGYKIYSNFNLRDFTEDSINQKVEFEFNKIKKDIDGLKKDLITKEELNPYSSKLIGRLNLNDDDSRIRRIIKDLLVSISAPNYFDLVPKETLFLNFNYTDTEHLYKDPNQFDGLSYDTLTSTKVIHIHGSLKKMDNNPIIFGFGDELDENYSTIEKLNDNQYLENIKSINYLKTDNYKKLLEFINSENYQIFIFGHSCGVSDRTLLNTLFEHPNCSSIKSFYHKKSDTEDNYNDIVKNISRNFNDKSDMRNKVVNRTYCEQLGE